MNSLNRLLQSLRRRVDRYRSSDMVLLVLLSVCVGLSSASGVWLFKQAIVLFQRLAFGALGSALAPLGHWTVIIPTVLGGLLVGWIMRRWVGHERVHGVAGIMESEALAGGRLPFQKIPAKAIAAALSIGAGASVGPEDPSVQIGANLGSMLGQFLRLSDERVRALVAAGAAGGISAAFNAPIAAVFFAIEIVLGELSGASLSVVVLSSVISAVLTQALSGREPAFHVPAYTFNSVFELPLYLLLGLLCGVVAVLYERILFSTGDIFRAMALPEWIKPALGGLIVGVVGLIQPQVLGVGYETITTIFAGASFTIVILLVLMTLKLALTSVSLGSGFQGGMFAPSLFLGAALGAAFGLFASNALPGLHIVPGAFAMVGMAGVLAGAVRAPLTAILLLFEMTNDYRIILPLMFAVVISILVSERLQRESIYTLPLMRQGIRLERGRDVEVLEGLTVGEIMTRSLRTLHTTDSLARALEVFTLTHSHGFPVVDAKGALAGIFTLQDLEKAQQIDIDLASQKVGDYATQNLIVTYPDETLSAAMRRMSVNDIGRMPVVEAGDPLHIIGLLRRSDIIKAYDIAVSRRTFRRHRLNEARLNMLSHLPVEEMRVEEGCPAANHTISELNWPADVIIASVQRHGQIIVPHGKTLLLPGDLVVFVSETPGATRAMQKICSRN